MSALEHWEIDRSTGTEILVYKKCSVIEDEQAQLVMGLLSRAEIPALEDVARAVMTATPTIKGGWDAAYKIAKAVRALTPLAPAQAEIERVREENQRNADELLALIARWEARALAAEEQVRVMAEALNRARVAMCSDAGPTLGDLEAIKAALHPGKALSVEEVAGIIQEWPHDTDTDDDARALAQAILAAMGRA